jgi:hypothetical protein
MESLNPSSSAISCQSNEHQVSVTGECTTYSTGHPFTDGSGGFVFEPLFGSSGHHIKLVVESGVSVCDQELREGVKENFVVPHGGREEDVSKPSSPCNRYHLLLGEA